MYHSSHNSSWYGIKTKNRNYGLKNRFILVRRFFVFIATSMLFSGQFDHLAFCFSVRSVTKEKIGTVHIALLLIVFGSHILAKEKGDSVWSLLLLFDGKFRIDPIKGNT